MDIRESLWKYSKSIGDVYGDLGAANRVGIVSIFFHDWIFFFIQTGKSTTKIYKPTHMFELQFAALPLFQNLIDPELVNVSWSSWELFVAAIVSPESSEKVLKVIYEIT